jgi:hypothetical protein
MSRSRKLLRTLLVVGATAGLATYGTFSAFSAETVNDGNQITTGTVVLGDNDGDVAVYSKTGAKPGEPYQKCITVTYTGTLDADVKLYMPAAPSGTLAPYVDLLIEPGTQATPNTDCSGFTADGSSLFSGTLAAFASTHTGWTNGLADYPGTTATKWTSAAGTVTYRITATVQNTNDAAGKSAGSHAFKWEARNQ